MKIILPLGTSAICFIISYIAFHNQETGTGWLFLGVGLVVFVIGLLLGQSKE
jgi:1,4-dihydroxy-2-naphthoate octaprenyltransferase